MEKPQTHLQRLGGRDAPLLVTASEEGRPAWFVLRVHPSRMADFKRMNLLRHGDIADYGDILESGWGEVDEALYARLKRDHGLRG